MLIVLGSDAVGFLSFDVKYGVYYLVAIFCVLFGQ